MTREQKIGGLNNRLTCYPNCAFSTLSLQHLRPTASYHQEFVEEREHGEEEELRGEELKNNPDGVGSGESHVHAERRSDIC